MKTLYRFLLVLLLLVLVGAGLNTSNAGMNCLTGEDRPDIINAHIGDGQLVVTFLGQHYDCSRESTISRLDILWQRVRPCIEATKQYLCKIWRIFRVLVFY
ncbi:MAG: hypothetical protein U9N81_03495 [Bacillota bacterium]|nr:hypothetical protein [Bacillota bacterium]